MVFRDAESSTGVRIGCRRAPIASVLLLLLTATVAEAQVPCRYEITQTIQGPFCGPLGYPSTIAVAVSPNGVYACGDIHQCSNGYSRGFFYNTLTHQFTLLPHPPGITDSTLRDINDDGLAVGRYGTSTAAEVGFVYNIHTGQYTELKAVFVSGYSSANAINSAGIVCGYRGTSTGYAGVPYTAFRWSVSNGFTDLGALGGSSTYGTDITDSGVVTGTMEVNGVSHAYLWEDNGQLTDLGTLAGKGTVPLGMNEVNQVVGRAFVPVPGYPNGVSRPFLWSEGQFVELPILPGDLQGFAQDINTVGLIVGSSRSASGSDIPMLWHEGQGFNLRDLCPTASGGYVLRGATAIHDDGRILAVGTIPGGYAVTFVLTPVPHPIGDIDGDCRTAVSDLIAVINAWGNTKSPADLDHDGVVGVPDLLIVINNWTFK